MFLLPKFIYFCRAIPYIIPKSYIDKLQSVLLKFIWSCKRSRVNKQLLFQDTNLFPKLEAYNVAAILDQAAVLWNPSSVLKWVLLENDTLGNGTNREFLIAIYLDRPVPSAPPPPQILLCYPLPIYLKSGPSGW